MIQIERLSDEELDTVAEDFKKVRAARITSKAETQG